VKRRHRVFLILLVLLVMNSDTRSQQLPAGFQQLLKRSSMTFAVPPGCASTQVVPNEDVMYDYAMKSKSMKLEIRYRIWPIELGRPLDQTRNRMFMTMLMTMALNISGGATPKATYYPEDDVRKEFGADAGATCAVKTDSDFGAGYTICLISVIHKDDVADAYVFYLCDDVSVATHAMGTNSIFHALRFR